MRMVSSLHRLAVSCTQCMKLQSTLFVKRSSQVFSCRQYTSQIAEAKDYYDVVIAGGGMVGTAMACALGHQYFLKDRRILLLEASPKKDLTKSSEFVSGGPYDNRVYAISPGSKELFEEIGTWEGIESRRLKPFEKMHVFDSCSSGAISFDASSAGEPHLAYIIENKVIMDSLLEQLENVSDCVTVMHSSKIKDLKLPGEKSYMTNENAFLELENGEVIETKLVIGADGYNSFVREKSGLETVSYDYRQSAVVATLKLGQSGMNDTAWQRFLPSGPIALLPLADDMSSLVWSTSREHAKTLLQLPEDRFINAINNAFADASHELSISSMITAATKDVLSVLQPGIFAGSFMRTPPTVIGADLSSRAMFPLGMKHATQYVKQRVALIGDAAHRIHPMAGQGVNLGFGDVKCLTDVLLAGIKLGEDFGSLETLLPYESERQRKNVPILAGISGLNYLFSTARLPLVLARTFGLQATNALSPLKRQIISYAMR